MFLKVNIAFQYTTVQSADINKGSESEVELGKNI